MPVARLEKSSALRKALDKSLAEQGLRSQWSLARNTILGFDSAYRSYLQYAGSLPELGFLSEDFFRKNALSQIASIADLNRGTINHLPAKSRELERQVDEFKRAYQLLIQHADPGGWLSKFLKSHPQFTEYLGGLPDWLPPEPTDK